MPKDEPAKLTLASSIAAQNQGQPKLLDQFEIPFERFIVLNAPSACW